MQDRADGVHVLWQVRRQAEWCSGREQSREEQRGGRGKPCCLLLGALRRHGLTARVDCRVGMACQFVFPTLRKVGGPEGGNVLSSSSS